MSGASFSSHMLLSIRQSRTENCLVSCHVASYRGRVRGQSLQRSFLHTEKEHLCKIWISSYSNVSDDFALTRYCSVSSLSLRLLRP